MFLKLFTFVFLLQAWATQAQKNERVDAPGNLESTQDLRCGDTASNKSSPADLLHAMADCLSKKNYEEAVFFYSLAYGYSLFDEARVRDKTAHQATTVLLMNELGTFSQEEIAKFNLSKREIENDKNKVRALCARISQVGMPQYYPHYMIEHGVETFLSRKKPKPRALNPDFNAEESWIEIFKVQLRCE